MPPLAAPRVATLDALFKGFADPTRIRILNLLAARELCVCDIVAILDRPQPAVSRHLAYLRRTKLVEATWTSRFAHYRLAAPAHSVHANLISSVRSCFRGIGSLNRERKAAARRVTAREADPCD